MGNNGKMGITLEERFWSKVDKKGEDECWNWLASLNNNSYGKFAYTKDNVTVAHRVAYELTNGKIKNGNVVCHTCDNMLCCNPNHLIEGTQKDNIKDCINKGRANTPKGELHGMAILSRDDVSKIRELYKTGIYYQYDLAKMFGISLSQISKIINKKAWV